MINNKPHMNDSSYSTMSSHQSNSISKHSNLEKSIDSVYSNQSEEDDKLSTTYINNKNYDNKIVDKRLKKEPDSLFSELYSKITKIKNRDSEISSRDHTNNSQNENHLENVIPTNPHLENGNQFSEKEPNREEKLEISINNNESLNNDNRESLHYAPLPCVITNDEDGFEGCIYSVIPPDRTLIKNKNSTEVEEVEDKNNSPKSLNVFSNRTKDNYESLNYFELPRNEDNANFGYSNANSDVNDNIDKLEDNLNIDGKKEIYESISEIDMQMQKLKIPEKSIQSSKVENIKNDSTDRSDPIETKEKFHYECVFLGSCPVDEQQLQNDYAKYMAQCISDITNPKNSNISMNRGKLVVMEVLGSNFQVRDKNLNKICLLFKLSTIRIWAIGKEKDSKAFAIVTREKHQNSKLVCRLFLCEVPASQVTSNLNTVCLDLAKNNTTLVSNKKENLTIKSNSSAESNYSKDSLTTNNKSLSYVKKPYSPKLINKVKPNKILDMPSEVFKTGSLNSKEHIPTTLYNKSSYSCNNTVSSIIQIDTTDYNKTSDRNKLIEGVNLINESSTLPKTLERNELNCMTGILDDENDKRNSVFESKAAGKYLGKMLINKYSGSKTLEQATDMINKNITSDQWLEVTIQITPQSINLIRKKLVCLKIKSENIIFAGVSINYPNLVGIMESKEKELWSHIFHLGSDSIFWFQNLKFICRLTSEKYDEKLSNSTLLKKLKKKI